MMISAIAGELSEFTGVLTDPPALRSAMAEQGYVLLRGLLAADDIERVRADIRRICGAAGWFEPGREQEFVVAAGVACTPPDPAFYQVFDQVIALESYNALPHNQALLDVVRALLDAQDVIPRPVGLARLIFPQREVGATPPHQDFPHEQGTPNAYTSWIALGDIERELGGLAIWPGSHRRGVLEHGFVPGVGGLGIDVSGSEAVWYTTDFRVGDVLLFHSMTVHGALLNTTENRLRISTDFRFQRASEPMTPHMLRPSGGRITWEDVYRDWSGHDLRYYWTTYDILIEEYDRKYYDKRDGDAFRLAREGDPYATEFLRTIAARNPDPEMRRAAVALLEEVGPPLPTEHRA
jgi:ectoine hydroxylase-related dioxygenase (phytanoyl-CoA dioxygenase family)